MNALRRKNTFAATIKGIDGIWERQKSGGLKLIYAFEGRDILSE